MNDVKKNEYEKVKKRDGFEIWVGEEIIYWYGYMDGADCHYDADLRWINVVDMKLRDFELLDDGKIIGDE